jgi:hypothetical protein
MGSEYCVECDKDTARANERQRVLDMINLRLTAAQSGDVIHALLRLKEDLKTRK